MTLGPFLRQPGLSDRLSDPCVCLPPRGGLPFRDWALASFLVSPSKGKAVYHPYPGGGEVAGKPYILRHSGVGGFLGMCGVAGVRDRCHDRIHRSGPRTRTGRLGGLRRGKARTRAAKPATFTTGRMVIVLDTSPPFQPGGSQVPGECSSSPSFGSPAVTVPMADPRLCAPASREVCPYRERVFRLGFTARATSTPSIEL
jgi:hypothetical protein